MTMRVPDFYIVGASKCGTTALADYLSHHAAICFALNKEPHFYAEDRPAQKAEINFSDYWRRNFRHFNPSEHKAIGEGSGTYYVSDVAIPNILKANPRARFIYMIRNPVEMLHSWYYDLRFSNSEELSLEEGWELETERAKGLHIPRQCPDPHILQYRKLASLGHRLEIMKNVIPEGQLMVIVLDDLAKCPKDIYEEVLAFLGVPSDGRTEFGLVNTAKEQRNPLLGIIAASVPNWLHQLTREVKSTLGIGHVPLNFLNALNMRRVKKTPLSADFRNRLLAYFESDIVLLERHLRRDFRTWRK
jgi:hypothetical protein